MASRHGTFGVCLLNCLVLLMSVVVISGEECVKTGKNACSCKNSKGLIDLSKLSSTIGGGPRWKDQKSEKDAFLYSYDPCTPFQESPGGACQNVLGCQVSSTGAESPLADPSTLAVKETDGLLTFTYTAFDTSFSQRTLHVELHCANREGDLQVIGEETPNSLIYKMKLTSVYACYNGVAPSSGISFGTVLCILFFLGLFIYFLGGFLFLTYLRNARGAERIPNVEFWKDLPNLIKDGTLFVTRGCKAETSYDTI